MKSIHRIDTKLRAPCNELLNVGQQARDPIAHRKVAQIEHLHKRILKPRQTSSLQQQRLTTASCVSYPRETVADMIVPDERTTDTGLVMKYKLGKVVRSRSSVWISV